MEAGSSRAGEVAVSRVAVAADIALKPLSENTFFSVSVGYADFFFDNSTGTPLPDQLETVEAGLNVRHTLNERWTLRGGLTASFNNADGSFSTDGFALGARLLAIYRFSETLTAGAGFAYNTLSETLPIMPIAAVSWQFAPDWSLTLGYPHTRVTWTANKRLSLYVGLDIDSGSFYVEDDPSPSAAGKPSLSDTVLDYTAIGAGLGGSYRLTDSLTLEASVGYNFSRTADYDERDYELESEGGAPSYRLVVVYAF